MRILYRTSPSAGKRQLFILAGEAETLSKVRFSVSAGTRTSGSTLRRNSSNASMSAKPAAFRICPRSSGEASRRKPARKMPTAAPWGSFVSYVTI